MLPGLCLKCADILNIVNHEWLWMTPCLNCCSVKHQGFLFLFFFLVTKQSFTAFEISTSPCSFINQGQLAGSTHWINTCVNLHNTRLDLSFCRKSCEKLLLSLIKWHSTPLLHKLIPLQTLDPHIRFFFFFANWLVLKLSANRLQATTYNVGWNVSVSWKIKCF